ncbi:MAG: ribonucleoside triphosphate reductase, partial [Candidatus Aenigmatarchaeota archaeon]
DWENENAKLLFELTSKYGTPYFQNYIGSDLEPGAIRAMCCRLNMDIRELMNRPGNMWGPGDNTGSIGVVTINMNRLGYEAKSEEEFFEKLKHYMLLARDALEIKRKVIEKNLQNGLMPYTKTYLGTFNNHFSTIGLCGMNECCVNFLKKDISTPEGKAFTIKVLKFMRDMIRQFQMETGNLYNLEATPAESTSYRLARLDKQMYPDIYTAGEKEPYLTNSTQLPVNYTDDLVKALEHQNDIQPLYTGGTIFHTFLGERLSSGEAAKTLVKKIAFNTKLPYFSITPTFSICKEHGYQKGEVEICPTCGRENEVYTRIVGYFRPVRNWNAGKQEEFRDRLEFSEKKALEKPMRCMAS